MDLKIFAKTIEDACRDQVMTLARQQAFKDAKIRIMPDCHAGKGCVIGFTADLGDKVVPNLVGVDVGCGMYVVYLGKYSLSESQLAAVDEFIHLHIPSGENVNDKASTVMFDDLPKLRMYGALKNVDRIHSSIGSLGGGNHFIELDMDSQGGLFLVIHSGSRNLGKQVCNYYQKIAIDECNFKTKQIKEETEFFIKKLKEEGRQKEISGTIKELRKKYGNENKIPDELCYLTGQSRDAYLFDMSICQSFATKNREEIARRIYGFLHDRFGVEVYYSFQTVHNYIDFDDNIVRKGAIRCNKGERVIIPLNMRDGSILAVGKGNLDWNYSGPHGAGRLMSRKEAKQSISMEDFKNSMAGIYTTSVDEGTLDESPMAYKNAQEIIEAVKDTVEIETIIRPIYNFKASE